MADEPRPRLEALAAALVYLLLAVVLLAPFSLHLADHVIDHGDSLLNVWILSWVTRALWVDPTSLYHGNAFYPFPYGIAFSDAQLASVPLFAPVLLVTGNPVLAHNLLVVVSFALSGLCAFWLGRAVTGSAAGGLVAGTAFGLAPYRFGHLAHVQLLTTHWIPLAFLGLHLARRDPRWRYFVAVSASLVLQALSSFYSGLFLAVGLGSFVGYLAVRRQLDRRFARRLAVASLAAAISLVPFAAPYFAAQRHYGFTRNLGEVWGFSAAPGDYARANPRSLLYGESLGRVWPERSPELAIFPGFVAPLLAAVGLASRRTRSSGGPLPAGLAPFAVVLVVAVLLSFGPWLALPGGGRLPMPYLLAYHAIPGFRGLRVPARFVVLVTLALGVLAGQGVAALAACATRRRGRLARGLLVAAVTGALALESAVGPVAAEKIEVGGDVPRVYRWLAEQRPGTPVVDLPFERTRHAEVMYFSTYHWQPLVNGISGFQPPAYHLMARACRALPAGWTADHLRDAGVQLVVLRLSAYAPGQREDVATSFDSSDRVRLVASFDTDRVYRLLPP